MERFLPKVSMTTSRPDDCWTWTAGRQSGGGYGVFWFQGRVWLAHRWIWECLYGPIPDEDAEGNRLDLDHLCRNVACVKPSHLELVTHQENMRRSCVAKLTDEKVQWIIDTADTISGREAARMLGISQPMVSKVRTGMAWSDVTGIPL